MKEIMRINELESELLLENLLNRYIVEEVGRMLDRAKRDTTPQGRSRLNEAMTTFPAAAGEG